MLYTASVSKYVNIYVINREPLRSLHVLKCCGIYLTMRRKTSYIHEYICCAIIFFLKKRESAQLTYVMKVLQALGCVCQVDVQGSPEQLKRHFSREEELMGHCHNLVSWAPLCWEIAAASESCISKCKLAATSSPVSKCHTQPRW